MIEGIDKYIENGLITVQSHPEFPELVIYNYTQKCQYENAWDEVTTKCRGLIFNKETGQKLSNPFPKFFNYGEYVQKGWKIPEEKPWISSKYDGWCGILYFHKGIPRIATRGSFASVGAVWATQWLHDHVALGTIDPDFTYVFEIISPETKIVVNYDFEGLVLLAKRHIETGEETFWYPGMVPMLKRTPPNYMNGKAMDEMMYAGMHEHESSLDTLKEMAKPNDEGVVVWFKNANLRMKVKWDEYVRLHKIITGLSAIGIWEALASGSEITLENVPDEFFEWFTRTRMELQDAYSKIYDEAREQFYDIGRSFTRAGNLEPDANGFTLTATASRKDVAEKIKTMTHPGIGFAMLDNKPVDAMIWKMVRPHGAKSFRVDLN